MSRSKIGREEIKWQDLLQHFRAVQSKHEKARRQAHGLDHSPFPEFDKASESSGHGDKGVKAGGRIPMRRRVTGGDLSAPSAPMLPPAVPSRAGALSPLNPKRTGTALSGSSASGSVGPALTAAQKARRPEFARK
jgi:vacuole morphology and inheritance protein 14